MAKLFSLTKIYTFLFAILLVSIAIFSFSLSPVFAISVPQYMSYQGQLFDSDDEAVSDTVSIEFTLYDAPSGGSEVWSETQTVVVDSGYFAVTLGSVNPLDISWQDQYYITLNIDSDGEMSPRQSINTSAYAFTADMAYRTLADSSAPVSSVTGSLYFDTSDSVLKVYDGSNWITLVTSTVPGVGDVVAAANNTLSGDNEFTGSTILATTTVNGPALLGSYLQFTTNGTNHLYFGNGTANRISWNDSLDQFEVTNDLSVDGGVTGTSGTFASITVGTLTVTTTVSFPNDSITDAMIPDTITATNYLARANNLSDLSDAAVARTNLGIGSDATSATILLTTNNLAGLTNTFTARNNLGLGSVAILNTAQVLQSANNLSDIVDDTIARANLGLGSIAVENATSFLRVTNNFSELTNTSSARTNLGLGTVALQNAGAVTLIGGTIDNIIIGSVIPADAQFASSTITTLSVTTLGVIGTNTTTFAGSINLSSGDSCFAIDGVCLTDSGAGALQAINNLSDITSTTAARTNLGLGSAAVLNASDVLLKNDNLSGLNSLIAARTNLGLGNIATESAESFLRGGNNLSDLANSSTARVNLGLGSIATLDSTSVLSRSANLGDILSSSTARANLGLGTLATQQGSAVVITGGAVDGTIIGATVSSTATFSSSTVGALTIVDALTVLATGTSTFSGNIDLPSGSCFSVDGVCITSSGAGILQAANNLSDVVSSTVARTNLGLGSAAVLDASVFLLKSDNLSGLTNTSTARTNLGLGSIAVANVGDYLTISGGALTGALSGTSASFTSGTFGSVSTTLLTVSGTATTTFAGSIQVPSGYCFSVNGTCLTGSGGTIDTGTAGQIGYYGVNGTTLTPTSALFVASSGNIGIGTTGPDRRLEINSATGNNLRLTYNDSNGSATNFTDFTMSSIGDLTIVPSGGDTNITGALNVTASLSGNNSTAQNITVNTSGSGAGFIVGQSVTLNAGYTGSGFTQAQSFDNITAGTNAVYGADTTLYGYRLDGNRGAGGYARGVTVGHNVGGLFLAGGGNMNYGSWSAATVTKNSATNVGVFGSGLNAGASAVQVGGYFTLYNAANAPPINTSAALIADNGTQTSPIFLARDNASTVFSIIDGGNVGVGDISPAALFTVGNGDLFQVNSLGAITAVAGITNSGNTTLGNEAGDIVTSNAATWSFPNATGMTFTNGSTIALGGGVNGLNIDNNTLSIDGLNNRVGIGTAAPLFPLTVSQNQNDATRAAVINTTNGSAAQAVLSLSRTADVSAQFLTFGVTAPTFAGALGEAAYIQADSVPIKFGTLTANDINLFTDGVANTRLTVSGATGNVGIGIDTAEPGAALEVRSGADQLRISYSDTEYLGVSVGSDGSATITPTGNTTTFAGFVNVPSGYCFAIDGECLTDSGAGALQITNNLSDLANTSTARTNLGLGSIATAGANDYLSITGGTLTGALIGTVVSSTDALFGAVTTTVLTVTGTNTSTFAGSINLPTGKCFAVNGECITSGGGGGSGTVSSGAAGYLAYYPSSGTTVDDSGMYWSGSAFGIGTTGPGRALEINSASGNNLRLTYNDADGSATNYTDFSLSSTGALTIDPSGTAATSIITVTAPLAVTGNNNSDEIVLSGRNNASGAGSIQGFLQNVNQAGRTQLILSSGIDTTPANYATNFFSLMTHGPSYAGGDIYLTGDGGDAGLGLLLGQGAQMTKFAVGTYNATPLSFFTSNTQRMFITGAGNVGVGDVTPAALFTVGNGDLFQVNSSGAIAAVTGIVNSGNLSVANNITVGDAITDTVIVSSGAWTFANDTTIALTGGVNGLNFDSNTLSIDATNNYVGIGTAAPSAKLHLVVPTAGVDGSQGLKIVTAAGTTSGGFEVGGSNDSYVGTISASDFHIRTNNTEYLHVVGGVTNRGNVGVGTVTSANTVNLLTIGGAASVGYTDGSSAPANGLLVNTRVNVGTTATDSNVGLYIANTTNGFAGLRISGQGNYAGSDWTVYASSASINSANDFIGFSNNSATDSATAGYKFVIEKSGNVGVGDTTPDYLLDVAGSLGVDGALTIGDASGDTVTSNAGAWTFANDTTVALTGGVNGLNFDSGTLSIDATNNRVGIGTTAPDFSLQVNVNSASSFGAFSSYSSTASDIASLYLLKSRGTAASPTALSSGDTIGSLRFAGQYGSTPGQYTTAAYVGAVAAGTFSGTASPAHLVFYTAPLASLTPAERLRITSEGLMGVGTTAPDKSLEINSATGAALRLTYNDNNGSATNYSDFSISSSGDLTIAPSGSDTSFTGTLASTGNVVFGDASEDTVISNAGTWTFASDTTVALTGGLNGLNFDTDTFSIDAENNRVGIGTSTPGYTLHVVGGGDNVAKFENASNGTACTLSGSTGLLTCTSDAQLKKDIAPIDASLQKILQLNPSSFHWLNQTGTDAKIAGFIAQDVESIFPDLVQTDSDSGYRSLSMVGLIPYLTKAIQEQQLQITALSSNLVGGENVYNGSFDGALSVKKHVAFGVDTVGQAKILAGSVTSTVIFSEEYQYMPIVAVTPVGSELLAYDFSFVVTDKSVSGFTVQISQSQPINITFDWHAFASEQGRLFVSDGTTEDIELVVVDEPSDLDIFVEEESGGGESADVEDVSLDEEFVEPPIPEVLDEGVAEETETPPEEEVVVPESEPEIVPTEPAPPEDEVVDSLPSDEGELVE